MMNSVMIIIKFVVAATFATATTAAAAAATATAVKSI